MNAIEWGFLKVYPYGVCVALSGAVLLCWAFFRTKDPEERRTLELFALIAIPASLVLGHLAYCLCDLDWISDVFWETVADFPGGGYLLYGALLGMLPALVAACRITGKPFSGMADLLAAPFLGFTALLAAADGLIGAGYGWKVEDWFQADSGMSLFTLEDPSFFYRFPFATTDSYYGYANWAVFMPVVLMLAGFSVILAMRKGRESKPGGEAVLAGALYASVRILYESLRQDDILKWGFVRVNQILSAVLLMALLLLCFLLLKKHGEGTREMLLRSLGIFTGGVILSGAMEFALEKKIGFLEWMPMDLCYVVSALGCFCLFLSCERLRKKAFGT